MSIVDVLTSPPSIGSPTIIPDDNVLAYWWTNKEKTTLQLYHYETAEIESVAIESDIYSPGGWEPIKWLGDQFLIQSMSDIYLIDRDGDVERLSIEEEHVSIIDIDSSSRRYLYIHYPDGLGSGRGPLRLRIYDTKTDAKTTLTEHPEQRWHAGFSPNNERIAYRENPMETFGEDEIIIADTAGNQKQTIDIGDATSRTRLYGWHPDGYQLLLDDRSTGWYRPGLYDQEIDETTWFGCDQYNEIPLTILPTGNRIVTTRFRNGKSVPRVYKIGQVSAGRQLDLADGVVNHRIRQEIGATLAPGHVLLKHETSTRPPRLLDYDLATDEVTTIVDTETDVLAEADLVTADHISYKSADGLEVNAVLHRAPHSPSPAVVKVHGGPNQAVYRGFDPFAQFLVSNGYTVLQPNYRGSTDQDRAFEEAICGDSGEGAVDDVAEGARWLAAKDWIDADQIAVFGHSAGAYNAAMQSIRHPDLWQVVIPENGALDRVKTLGDPNQYALRRIIDDPAMETQEEYLRERSPVHRTDDVDCPICIIQGENDVSIDMSREFVQGLEDRGWTEGEEFRFEVIEGAGHVISEKERLWNLVMEILNKYVPTE